MPELSFLKVGLAQAALTFITVFHAYRLNHQFFPTCIYLLRSSLSMLVLVTTGIYLMALIANVLRLILFGELRAIEMDHLQEYGWMTISESFLAMTIFRSEFDAKFAFIFAGLIICKGFHWISRDRVDYMEQAIRLPEGFHAKMLTTLYIMAVTDFVGATFAIWDVIVRGPSMSILAANEFCLMFVSLVSCFTRYVLNMNDIRRGAPWEDRSVLLFYLDFVFDLTKLLIYLFYFAVIVAYYGLPVHIIRDLYLTFRSFVVRINDIVRYRQATADMDKKYPNVTPEEFAAAADKVCIICRDEMEVGTEGPKKLPCGHFFHIRCLRSWLERQQACPTCRKPVFQPADVAAQYPGNAGNGGAPIQNAPMQNAPIQNAPIQNAPIQNAPIHNGDNLQQQHLQQVEPQAREDDEQSIAEFVRMTENNPVLYVTPENIIPDENHVGQYVLKDTLNGPNPVYLERVNIVTRKSMSQSTFHTDASFTSLSSAGSAASLGEKIAALEEVQVEIDGLLRKARRLQRSVEKQLEDDEQPPGNNGSM